MEAPVEQIVQHVARAAAALGGRAYLVGGAVRDRLLGVESKDADVEIHGLELERVEELLARCGEVIQVGRAFGVFRVKGIDVDFSLPRRDSKRGPGHRGFDVLVEPHLGVEESARRRDLTINSMLMDPLSGEVKDPFHGQADLAAGRLKATDAGRFGEDPLRGLRVAQLMARFEMAPDRELIALCAALDLGELPGERILAEFRKLLLKGRRPSLGLEFLARTGLLRFFPELRALSGVPQDPEWHPEGDVFVHTLMVVDAAARQDAPAGVAADDREAVLFGALCHDFGKPATTSFSDGRWRSPLHPEKGQEPARAFLERMRAPVELIQKVEALVLHHLQPTFLVRDGATPRAYRRLARRLAEGGATLRQLERVARADHLGRTTPDARAGRYAEGDRFLAEVERLRVLDQAPRDVVLGRHLLARGLAPGPALKGLLERCREVQDETGLDDPEQILERVLGR